MKKKAGIILVVLLVCLLSTVIVACENTIYYTVTFETNGGSQVEEVSVNPGDSIASPTSTKEGYVLEGWYDNADFNGEKITFPYTPDKDTKLYAKWSIESYVGTYVGLVSYVDEGYAHYIGLVPHVYEIFIMTLNEDGTGKFVGAGSDFEVGFSHYYGREFDAKYAIDGGKISIEVTKSLDFRPEVFYLNGSVKNGVITLSELSSFSDDNFTNVVFNRINSDNQAVLGTYSDIVPEGLLEEGIVKLHVALDADSNVKYLYESATGEIGSDEDDTDMQYLIVGDTILLLRDFGDRISITRGIFVDGAITMYGGLWQFVFTRNLSGGTVCETGKHEFGRWIVSQSAFCVSEGVERRACKVCGIKESKTIPPTGVHSSYYRSDDEEHRYVCVHCDYVDVEKSGKHNYGNEIVEKEPTCGYMGRGYRECGVCEHRIYFDIPATGEHTCIDEYNHYWHWQYCSVCYKEINGASHEFLEKNDSTGHWKECSGCEYVSETIPHTLDYAYDAKEHWSKCEDCDYVVDKTAHTMTEKSDVNNHWTECTVCNYKSAETVHTYENRYDKDNHWEECSGCSYVNNKKAHVLTLTNNETEHWHQCSECSYKSEIETHAYEEAYDKSNHWQQCSVCAYVKDKTAHTTLSIRHDDTYHWRGCDDCEYTEDQQAYNKYATWGKNDEEHWQHCSVCSQEINRSTHGNFRITHERERGLHNELCGTCGINAGLQVDCFSNEWKASDKSHFNTCDYCNEFVKLEHEFDIFVAIGIDKCGCGEFKCNENLQYKLINDNTEYSVSYDKTAETELITLILPDYYEDPVTGEILPVTRIEDNGFTGLEISEFFISPSINFIQGYAFSGSKINTLFIEDMNAWCNMSYSFMGNSLLPVVEDIYYDMKYVNDLILPDGITNINSYAFEGYAGLKSVTIPDSVTRIGEGVFEGCKGIESITLPFIGGTREGVYKKHFGYIFGAYSYSENYTYVPASLKAVVITSANVIGERAFYECSGLTSITISDSVKTIGERAFEGCSGLEIITLPFIGATKDDTGNTHFYYIFGNSSSSIPTTLKTVVITSATAIGDYAFYNCSGLTSITIPDSVTTIGESAFSGCSGLTSITIPESVTTIGDYAFSGCSGLTSITIPDSVTKVGNGAFSGCDKLIYNEYQNILYLGNKNSPYLVLVKAEYYYLSAIIINENTKTICTGAFYGCSGLESITVEQPNARYHSKGNCIIETESKTLVIGCKTSVIPSDGSVTTIGEDAFSGCSGLTSITIPDSVTTIGYSAFRGCSGLTSITIPDSVTTIGNGAFSGCSGLTSITIPDSVTTIGNGAFSGCSGLTSITIPDGVTSIGESAFAYCSGLESITLPFIGSSKDGTGNSHFAHIFGQRYPQDYGKYIPESLKTVIITSSKIVNNSFAKCSGLTCIVFGDNVTYISPFAFNGCSGLESIIVSEGNTMYHSDGNCIIETESKTLVRGCITSVIPSDGSVTIIGLYAFGSCSGLTSITIPEGVTTIGERAFSGCSELTSVVIGDSVTTIGTDAFWNCSALTSIIIPDSVTTIGSNAFEYCRGLTSVIIGKGTTTIGGGAFAYCSGLTSITISDSVTTIGDSAFRGCSGLTSITIPDSVTTIGDWAFSGCSGLTSITIPESVTTIGSLAFEGCSGLTSVVIGNGVTTIGSSAFWNCSGLTSITIPDSVTTIGENAFYGCSGLTSIIIGNSVTTIGDSAFRGCSGLTSITIPDSVTTIGDSAFRGCSGLTSITIPDSVTTIGDWAFSGCSGLTSITIPDSVTTIGSSAFWNCSGLTSITIPDSVTTIGDWAFRGCSGLTSITIPDSVITIGSSAFEYCSGLTIYVESSDKPNGWHHSWNYSNCPVVWDCDKNEVANDGYIYMTQDGLRYRIKDESASVIRQFIDITKANIPSNVIYKGKVYSVNSISERAFNDCSELTSITIPNTVTNIDYYAFSNCSRLERIVVTDSNPKYHSNGNCLIETASKTLILGGTTSVIPSDGSVTTISDSAFRGCSGLTSITIPDSVTTIGENAFYGCSGLTSIIIGNSVTTIGDSAFRGCSGLTSITIPDSVTTIGENAFYGCSGLTSIIIGNSVTTIGSLAFEGCSGLTSVVIGNGVTTIGSYAFRGCSGLTSITLPDSVTTIGDYAFYGCSGLTSITIPDSVTTIGSHAFYGCSGLTSITIPDSVTTIDNAVFYGCSGLTSITVPDSVTTIGDSAFSGCSGLTSVVIGNGVTTIGDSAFYNCRGLTSVVIGNGVTTIDWFAFRDCSGLTSIIYNGTMAEWQNISKDSYWNNNTGDYTIICTDGTLSKNN